MAGKWTYNAQPWHTWQKCLLFQTASVIPSTQKVSKRHRDNSKHLNRGNWKKLCCSRRKSVDTRDRCIKRRDQYTSVFISICLGQGMSAVKEGRAPENPQLVVCLHRSNSLQMGWGRSCWKSLLCRNPAEEVWVLHQAGKRPDLHRRHFDCDRLGEAETYI